MGTSGDDRAGSTAGSWLGDAGRTPSDESARDDERSVLTVLLAEDDEAMRDMVTEILRAGGYRVIAARDGAEAIAMAESGDLQFDCVVTDEVMPGARGRAVIERVRLRWTRVPVLLISGQKLDASELQRRMGGGVGYLRKPFGPTTLLDRLDRLMAAEGAV